MGQSNNQRGFDAAQNLGADLVGALNTSFQNDNPAGRGPFQQSLWTDLSPETKGLIGQGIGDNTAMRNGVVGNVAGGGWLSGGNPYLDEMIAKTRGNVSQGVNSSFNSLGLYGSDAHAKGLAEGMGNAELGARYGAFNDDWNRMVQGQGLLNSGNAQALGYSSLLDTNAQGQRQGEFDLHNRTSDPEFDRISKYLATLTGSSAAPGMQAQTPWWQTVAGIGLGTAAAFI